MQVGDGTVAAVPEALLAAGHVDRRVGDALRDAARLLGGAGGVGGSTAVVNLAWVGLVNSWSPALRAVAAEVEELSLLVEGTAADFLAADGQ